MLIINKVLNGLNWFLRSNLGTSQRVMQGVWFDVILQAKGVLLPV